MRTVLCSRRVWAAIAASCFVGVALLGYFVAYPQGQAYYHSDKGQQALEDQDYPSAREHWGRVVEVWPNSGKAHFFLARSWRGNGGLAEATHHLDKAEELRWSTNAIDLERLLIRAQSGDVDSVAPPFQMALGNNHPESALILEALVLGFLEVHRLHEARVFAALLSTKFPERWRSHLLLGQVQELFLRQDLAAAEFRRVLELKANQLETRLWLASYLESTGSAAEALANFQVYQQARPDDVEARLGIAACRYDLGQLQEARNLLEPMPAGLGENARALALRGRIELDLNGAQEARPWLEQAEALAPNNLDAVNSLAVVWRQLGNADKARVFEERKLRLQKDHAAVETLTGQLAALDQNSEPTDQGRRAQLRYQLGALFLRLGEDQKGLAWLGSALQEDPRHGATHQTLADHYRQVGNLELAQFHRQKARESPEPSNAP